MMTEPIQPRSNRMAPRAVERPFRAHHGSISLPERRATEDALKAGDVPAVIATASLELGIDMGAVDLVCQVESPGSVSRGLQRVGRAGHVVRGVSKGRMIAKTPGDLLESAALCRAMLRGEIEHLQVPHNCLDVLAQQVIACVAMDPWDVPALYDLVRSAYPFQNLSRRVVRERLAADIGPLSQSRAARPEGTGRLGPDSQPAVGLARDCPACPGGGRHDSGHRSVSGLPGGGGAAPGRARRGIRLRDGESVRRSRWVMQAGGSRRSIRIAWWFLEPPGKQRSCRSGEAKTRLARASSARRSACSRARFPSGWMIGTCKAGSPPSAGLTPDAARALREYLARQKRLTGMVPDDRTILVETFIDPTGELSLAVLTPLGGRLHHALKLALCGVIRERSRAFAGVLAFRPTGSCFDCR